MLFPLFDHNPVDRLPIITFMLIGLNVLCWLVVQTAGTNPGFENSLCRFGFIGGDFLGTIASGTPLWMTEERTICYTVDFPYYTLMTHMFMHDSNFMHLVGNMWFLWLFGDNIENALGRFKFLIFYLFCGCVAAFVQVLPDIKSAIPMIGASGAVSGVMGGYIVLHPRARIKALLLIFVIEVPSMVILGVYFGYQVLLSLSTDVGGGGVAYLAHIGGFIAGLLLVKPFKGKEKTYSLQTRL